MRKELLVALQILLISLMELVIFAPIVRAESIITAEDRALQKFQGMNFGLGVGVVGTPSQRLAKSAQVVNGVVRVEDEANVTASVILESHYFFTTETTSFLGIFDAKKWGHGPFVAIRSGGTDNQFIDAIGLGWMFGFRYKESMSSWNIGAGVSLTPSARVLGDGITKNQPLPPGETDVRFKSESLLGFMVLASFSWTSFE